MCAEQLKLSMLSTIKFYLDCYLSNVKFDEVREDLLKDILALGFVHYSFSRTSESISYSEIDTFLSKINEKESIRKKNGVYYTENDITRYIIEKCILHSNLHFFLTGSIFDPTCGTGEFLISALKRKLVLNEIAKKLFSVQDILKTIYGNDLNPESILISKLRFFLLLISECSYQEIRGIVEILNENFSCSDFFVYSYGRHFDYIIGNPPYVEDRKISKFGNLYADILEKASVLSTSKGVIGFIIPLSYVATPRMSKIRKILNSSHGVQYIYSFSDRPSCLFSQVHQKVSILIAKRSYFSILHTNNYQYWYRNQRKELFSSQTHIINPYQTEEFIPKLGTSEELEIYRKVKDNEISILDFIVDISKNDATVGNTTIFLNMRACFWIKAFFNNHSGNEYKKLICKNENDRNYLYCILNSSLFWWFWVCISDCWHITKKELKSFNFPKSYDTKIVKNLSSKLEYKLEQTKKYIGTKQIDYEYKHKLCLDEIHEIDDYINFLFDLNESQNEYIKQFCLIYRVGGGSKN